MGVPTEARPLTLPAAVRRAIEVVDPNGSGDPPPAVAAFVARAS